MAVNVLLVYLAGARGGTWLSTVIALVIMGLVAYAIVVFAGRVTSAGSFYTWVAEGLGNGTGHAAGWGLLLGYICTGMATIIGFALYGSSLINDLGGPNGGLPIEVTLMAVCAVVAVVVTVADVKLSARTALTLEAVSVAIIIALGTAAAVSMAFVFWVNWLPQVPHNTWFSPLTFPYNILPYVFLGWTVIGIGSYLMGRRPEAGRDEQFTVRAVPAVQAVSAQAVSE